MSSSISLTDLIEAGIILTHHKNDSNISSDTTANPKTVDVNTEFAKALSTNGMNSTAQTSTETIDSSADTQPSLLWKAYAIALASILTPDNDLRVSKKAVFIAGPTQFGVPAGEFVDPRITNGQLFRKADALQDYATPFYEGGDSTNGSCVEYLYNYFMRLDDENTIQEKLRLAMEKSKEAAERARAEFNKLPINEKTFGVEAWIARDKDYEKCRADEAALASAHSDHSLKWIGLRRYELSECRLSNELRRGLNMPCSNEDIRKKVNAEGQNNIKPIDENSIYYRPSYTLNGYSETCDWWWRKFSEGQPAARKILSLKQARQEPWGKLGFPHLDQLTEPKQSFIEDNVKIELVHHGISAFDVDRGMWDVNMPRDAISMPQLNPTTPERLKKPILKIKRMLFSYGLEVVLTFPGPIAGIDENNQSLAILDMPVTGTDLSNNIIRLSTGTVRNDMYPRLVAVLTKEW